MCYLSTVPGNCLVKYGQIWSGSNDKMWNMDRKGMQKNGPDFFFEQKKIGPEGRTCRKLGLDGLASTNSF